MSTGTPKLSLANLPTRGQIDQAGDLFEPRCEIRTTVRHAASGHVLDLAFENVPVHKVLELLDDRGLVPVERAAASQQPLQGETHPRAYLLYLIQKRKRPSAVGAARTVASATGRGATQGSTIVIDCPALPGLSLLLELNSMQEATIQERNTKFCIFCGGQPVNKNQEHIIPQWLIELTGKLTRNIQIGPFWSQEGDSKTFSFNAFKFPACEKCNSFFGKLESATKPIIIKMLRNQGLSARELNLLLMWLDKVRIGLWLGCTQYLDKNFFGVTPKFYIKQRTGRADRMVAIYKSDRTNQGINFVGCNNPIFAIHPSCFTLIINNIMLLNVSSEYMLSRQFGLPFPVDFKTVAGNLSIPDFSCGDELIKLPVVEFDNDEDCTYIYQPMFPEQSYPPRVKELYTTSFVQNMELDPDTGIGIPFFKKNGFIHQYPHKSSTDWLPPTVIENLGSPIKIAIRTLEVQKHLHQKSMAYKTLDSENEIQWMRQFSEFAVHYQERLIQQAVTLLAT